MVSRRSVLHSLGVAAITATAGCDIPFIGSVELPPVTDGWFNIKHNSTVVLMLRFGGDIESKLKASPYSRADIMPGLEDEGNSVTFQPVSVRGAGGFPDNVRVYPDDATVGTA